MSFQAAARIDAETQAANPRWISASETLRPGNQCIIVNSTSAAVNITMPDMAEAAGNIISIMVGTLVSDVSVLINETGLEIGAGNGNPAGDLDEDEDVSIFYCTGRVWVPIFTNVSA